MLIICILFPKNVLAMSQEQAGETIAQFAENLVNNYSAEFIYSWTDSQRYAAYWTIKDNQTTPYETSIALSNKLKEVGKVFNTDYCAYSIRCIKE